jgi:hypothetical protein
MMLEKRSVIVIVITQPDLVLVFRAKCPFSVSPLAS